ncbi:MAG: hypothetical protein AB1762_11560 [Gemmatimonadota bacterium]
MDRVDTSARSALDDREDTATASYGSFVNDTRGTELEDAVILLSVAASSRLPDEQQEQERMQLVEAALSSARAAAAALHMWAAQCLSEYRGSRTTWNVHATSELLGNTLRQFETTARWTAARLSVVVPNVMADAVET